MQNEVNEAKEGNERNRYLVVFLSIILVLFSILELRDASFDILPEFQPKTIQVQTEALGLSAFEVENLVTVNLEEMLTNTPWMEKMESTSVNGLSSINLTFSPDTDIMEARQMVSENLILSQQIPNVSKESIILQPLSTTNRVMAVGLTSETLSLIDISQLSRWNIKPALMSVPGVANVSVWGHRERQLQVQVDQEKMSSFGISLEDVIRTTGNAFWMSNLTYLEASTPGSGGWIDTPNQRLEIQHILPIRDEVDLSLTSFPDKSYLSLGDIANTVEGHQPLIGDAVLEDGKGILLVIEKYPQSNVLEVTKGVEDKLEELKVGLSDIEVDTTVYRPATFIESMLDSLMVASLLSFVLLFIGLIVFTSNIRVALFAFLSIALSLSTTFFVLSVYGTTFNSVLITGIIASLAIIVSQVVNGFEKSNRGIIQSGLITVLLLAPVFFFVGTKGLFYQSLAFSYIVSVVSGMFFAFAVFPSLVRSFSSETRIKNRPIALIDRLKAVYLNILEKTISKSVLVYLLLTLLLTVGSIIWLVSKDYDLMPTYKENTLVVEIENTPGTSLLEMNRFINEIKEDLYSIDGVSNFGAHIGRAVTGDQVIGINSAQIWVSISEQSNYNVTREAINNKLDEYPDIIKSVQTYSQDVMDKYLISKEEDLFVRVYGSDFEKLYEQAEKVKTSISRVEGVISPSIVKEAYTEVPGIEIKVDSEKANRYSLKPGDIRRAAAVVVNGLEVANRFEEQKVFEVTVWSIPEERRSVDDIKNILIDTPNGRYIRLQDVAQVSVVPMMSSINRESMSRYVDIVFEIIDDKKEIAQALEENLQDIEFTLEYHAEVKGNYFDQDNSYLLIGLFALVGIFLLLQSVFNSWSLAVLNFAVAPIALFGGILGVYIFDAGVLSLGSLIGLIAILAMSYQAGVLSIRHYQSLEREDSSGVSTVLLGSGDRFISIIITTLLISLVFLPFMIVGGVELYYSIAAVIISGLVALVLVNIFVLPRLYLWISNKNNHEA